MFDKSMNTQPEISKSTRHKKIAGDFGEALVLYWLSKHGFECAMVDHTGIDIIARNPRTRDLMGISVKSRTRNPNTVGDALNVHIDEYDKAQRACEAFGCQPYFALVLDHIATISVFIVSAAKLKALAPPGATYSAWKMTEAARVIYAEDPEVFAFEMACTTTRWWEGTGPSRECEPPPAAAFADPS
jgi:Holliday junction resolvase-like predicted endonuclease